MDAYIGTKQLNAKEMTRGDYNIFRGWRLPEDENGSDPGFLVEYTDGGMANTKDYTGYVSWSPKEVFEKSYQKSGHMNFGHALGLLKIGKKVSRRGWNGKNMFIVLMPELNLPSYNSQGTTKKVNDRTAKWIGKDTKLNSNAYLAMFTAQKEWQPGWLASQSDMLANDWAVI